MRGSSSDVEIVAASRRSTRCPRSRSRASRPTSAAARSRRTSAARCTRLCVRTTIAMPSSARLLDQGSRQVAQQSQHVHEIVRNAHAREATVVRPGFLPVAHLAGWLATVWLSGRGRSSSRGDTVPADRTASTREPDAPRGASHERRARLADPQRSSRGRPARRSFSRSRAWSWRSCWRACSRPTTGASRRWCLSSPAFVVVFTDSALGTALIQRRDLHDGDRRPSSGSSTGIGLAAGPRRHRARRSARERSTASREVRPLFAALSVGFFVSCLGTTHMALLAREMQFRRLELRQIAATVVGAVTGITVALEGFGAWAIVGQQLAEATGSTVLLWFLPPWRPSLTFSIASLRRLGGFAGNVFGENLLYQAGRNLGTPADRTLPRRRRGGRVSRSRRTSSSSRSRGSPGRCSRSSSRRSRA